jgi:dephospho-CoA kinase
MADAAIPRLRLGLGGGYCAGKSGAAEWLKKRGFALFDADAAGHAAIEAERESLVAAFGAGIVAEDGKVSRPRLAAMVFSDREKRERLEGIIHPAVNDMALDWLAARPHSDLAVHAALLHAMPLVWGFDAVLIIRAPWLLRLWRGTRRDKRGWGASLKRLCSQRGFDAKLKRAAREAGVRVIQIGNLGTKERLGKRLDQALLALRAEKAKKLGLNFGAETPILKGN